MKLVKRTLLFIISTLLLTVIPLASTSADSRMFNISGEVTSNGRSVRHAQVIVDCNGRSKYAVTNRHGMYSVSFRTRQCEAGSTVTVTADKGSGSGQSVGKVNRTNCHLMINVTFVSAALPELGLLTGVTATAASIGVMILIRNRTLKNYRA